MDVNLQKKYSPTNLFQNNTELFQNSLSEPTALTKKTIPKEFLM